MFAVVYYKDTKRVKGISSQCDPKELRKAIPDEEDFIFVDELPKVKQNRQDLFVEGNKLIVKDRKLSEQQIEELMKYELAVLRDVRQQAFSLLNKAPYWYETLTEDQHNELRAWRQEWLDITKKYTFEVGLDLELPKQPEWLK